MVKAWPPGDMHGYGSSRDFVRHGVLGEIQSDTSTGSGLTQRDFRTVKLAAKFVF
jgi:hypothetical protein